MKKNAACIILALALSAALCGCGSDRTDTVVTASPIISATPHVSPDVDDGIVEDTDGLIEDDTTEGDGMTGSDTEVTSPVGSTNPADSASPAGSAAPKK